MRVWDCHDGYCLRTLAGHDGDVNGLAVLADAKGQGVIASASDDGCINVWGILAM